MKKFFFILFGVFIILLYRPISFSGVTADTDYFNITVIKGDSQEIREVFAYSRLNEILTEDDLHGADLRKINLQKIVNHRDVIVIPLLHEEKCISINSDDTNALLELNGVGSQTAQRIIEYREQISSFHNIEDIMNVKGIKEKLFEKIKDYICL